MARTMIITATMEWPLENGQQASKLPLTFNLEYTDQNSLEKTYAAPISNDPIPLPTNGAKAIVLRAKTADVDVKINGSATSIKLKAGNGFIIITNGDGNVTSLTATVVTAPAKLEGYAFA
jgi:hypothetical protein